MSAILGFLSSVASIITQGAPIIWYVIDLFREAKLKGWVNDGRALVSQIQGAQTDEQRMALAKQLFESRAQ